MGKCDPKAMLCMTAHGTTACLSFLVLSVICFYLRNWEPGTHRPVRRRFLGSLAAWFIKTAFSGFFWGIGLLPPSRGVS